MAIFKDIDFYDEDILYLCDYVPESRAKNREKEVQDSRSINFILAYKNNKPYIVDSVLEDIYPILGDHFAIAVFPSSQVKKNNISASHTLVHRIIERVTQERGTFDIIDASECLYRFKDIPKQHKQKGMRSIQVHLDSVQVNHPELIEGRDVLVIDDITTSGSSMQAAFKLLKEKGANNVIGFVVGKTITNESLKSGVIFDLDQTLFDTSIIAPYRKHGSWDKAVDMAEKIEPYEGIPELLSVLKNQYHSDICVVTSTPREYAKVLIHKLGIPDGRLVSYQDVQHHKPDTEGYFCAKKLMQIYDPCIVVFGDDEEKDIKPANELGMTTVHAKWGGTTCSCADFTYDSPLQAQKALEDIMSKYNVVRNSLWKD